MAAIDSKQTNRRAVAFGRQLRAVMLEKNVSSRELGRRVARINRKLAPPTARRAIMKYLAGEVLPAEERRAELMEALDVGSDRLTVDEDDEESDLFLVLFESLRAIARHEIRREIERRV